MTTYTSLFPDEAVLLGRKFFKVPGQFNVSAPAGAAWGRVMGRGCGGQGADWGGSGAYGRSVFQVKTALEGFKLQVGQTRTASVLGDTWFKRNDGSVILYCDRGRGNATRGQASLSIGDVLRDGDPGSDGTGLGGNTTGDESDYAGCLPSGRGADYQFNHAADYGGGGHLYWQADPYGNFIAYSAWGAGFGILAVEWFDSQPHY